MHKYIKDSIALIVYTTIVVILLGVVILGGLYFYCFTEWIGLLIAILIFSIISGYNTALNGIQNAARQRTIVAFHSGFDAWLKILFAVMLMIILGNTVIAVVYGYVLSMLLVFASQLFFFNKVIRNNKEEKSDINWKKKI